MHQDIGKKIKELRQQRKWTLKELSEATGLSIGFLSQLERGLTNIAADSLQKLSQTLEVDPSFFFSSQSKSRSVVLRSYEKEVTQVINGKFIHYHLANEFPGRTLLPRLIELLPINSAEDISPYAHEGEEFIYVLEGTLTLFINQEQIELYPGDTAHYSSSMVHNWANYTNKMVRLLVVSLPGQTD